MVKFQKLSTSGCIQCKSIAHSVLLQAAEVNPTNNSQPVKDSLRGEIQIRQQSARTVTCFYAWERSGVCCLGWTEQKKSVCHLLSCLHSAFLASVEK